MAPVYQTISENGRNRSIPGPLSYGLTYSISQALALPPTALAMTWRKIMSDGVWRVSFGLLLLSEKSSSTRRMRSGPAAAGAGRAVAGAGRRRVSWAMATDSVTKATSETFDRNFIPAPLLLLVLRVAVAVGRAARIRHSSTTTSGSRTRQLWKSMSITRSVPWSREEVEATVADYLQMLSFELAGQAYNKAAHNRALLRQLNQRTRGAIELKHQNISAILLEQGFAYIPGYKPMGNYQLLLS